jgi:hypothetical protein
MLIENLAGEHGGSHTAFQHGAKEIHWFEEHDEADQEHGQRAFDMLVKYVDNEPLAYQCLYWAEESLKAR